jgi:hypothetical protein
VDNSANHPNCSSDPCPGRYVQACVLSRSRAATAPDNYGICIETAEGLIELSPERSAAILIDPRTLRILIRARRFQRRASVAPPLPNRPSQRRQAEENAYATVDDTTYDSRTLPISDGATSRASAAGQGRAAANSTSHGYGGSEPA